MFTSLPEEIIRVSLTVHERQWHSHVLKLTMEVIKNADAGEVEHFYIDPEMEQSEGSPPFNTSNKNDHSNYT